MRIVDGDVAGHPLRLAVDHHDVLDSGRVAARLDPAVAAAVGAGIRHGVAGATAAGAGRRARAVCELTGSTATRRAPRERRVGRLEPTGPPGRAASRVVAGVQDAPPQHPGERHNVQCPCTQSTLLSLQVGFLRTFLPTEIVAGLACSAYS